MDNSKILNMPDDQAVAALRAKDPEFYARFSDENIVQLIADLREMVGEAA